MDINTIKSFTEAAKNVTEIVKEPIHNLTNQPTRTIGAGLSDIFELIFAGPKTLNAYVQHKISQFKQELENGIEKIPNDKRVEPPLNIVGPALEAARFYINEDEIRSLFTNLIVCSMHEDKCNSVHPAFVEIIKQLKPIDAKVFSLLVSNNNYGVANIIYIYDTHDNKFSFMSNFSIEINNFIPFDFVNVNNYKEIETSIDNLLRLNLISISYTTTFKDLERYKTIENHSFYKSLNKKPDKDLTLDYQKGFWTVTPLGKNFAKACI